MGSQIQKEVKEVSCDGFVQTESKGSQFKAEGVSQEVNCQIIRPENEEEQISDDEGMICYKCDGTKVNKKGVPCRKCNGSGSLQNKFYKDLIKVVKEEVKSYTTQTFQRLMVDYLGKKAADQAG
jgi:DnaJ-class molecular chaperone